MYKMKHNSKKINKLIIRLLNPRKKETHYSVILSNSWLTVERNRRIKRIIISQQPWRKIKRLKDRLWKTNKQQTRSNRENYKKVKEKSLVCFLIMSCWRHIRKIWKSKWNSKNNNHKLMRLMEIAVMFESKVKRIKVLGNLSNIGSVLM